MKKRMLSYLMTGMLLLTMIPSMAFADPATLPELPIIPNEYFKGPFLIKGIQEPVAGDRISTMLSPTISSKTEGEAKYLRIDSIVWEYWDHETQEWQIIESPDEKSLTFQAGLKYRIGVFIGVKEHAPFKGFFAPILKKMRPMGDENMPQENPGENPPEVYFGDRKGAVYKEDWNEYQLISRYEFGPLQAPAAPVNSGASAGGSSGAQSSVRPDSAGSSSSQEAMASQSTTPST